jgi:hypothetical protein
VELLVILLLLCCGAESCNVVMCVEVMVGGEGGKWKGLQKGVLFAVM